MTMTTNAEPKGELHDAAVALLEAAMNYWTIYQRQLGGSAVVWISDSDGRTVILTRGEYKHTLMHNIDRVHEWREPGDPVLTWDEP